ncbi:hypothetical protein Poli38472_005977 [Pythium oligandrum]|uniref:Kinesin motor domain-containing protein n=1 Tax=Pythium oligandrum TaxID=41045 RepID=A0A8K1CSN6_PYTOL|nr:hypothetical protein Poli38472_005977 [Pythium oligandrum]|eukprot:TMW68509.1 hypothetical protein Poli38472_005977 [Pythium oligandrum]
MKDEKENEAENIRVAVRCRPMNDRELREQAVSCFVAEHGNAVLTNLENPSERHEFGFDHVYGCDTPQFQVFNDIGVPILDRAFGGYNGTIFAYGQTGSGKTFSMSGVRGKEELEGLIPRMNRAIFERISAEKAENPNKLFLVECSFFEIYNEIIYDLLDASGNSKKNKGGLEIKEHAVLGIYVKDLQERVVESRDEVIELMTQGAQARTVGYTQMNAESSRSHSIFVIKIHQKDATDESKNIFAKINLVDLAGSERAASTGAQGDRLKEGANINKSLSALGNVINALVEASRTGKKVFIPYRNSKLTRVLQESLGGNSLCSMLATLSPANINFIETLSTLKYASRAKSIKVNAKKNEASSQISQLNEEIAALKKRLLEQTSTTLGLDPKEKEEIVSKYEQQIKEMDRIRLQTWEDKAKLSKQHEMERKRLAKEKALADQKIREERPRKWKLLEEKGDVELMLRALRDLDRSGPASSTKTCAEDQWLSKAQAMKTLEGKIKDSRTLIMVFKDSLDKDVDQWAKRLDSKEAISGAAKRDESAAMHMISNQLCSKLQNIIDESKVLMSMEAKLLGDGSEMVNEMMSELIQFKQKRAERKAAKPSTATAEGTNRTASPKDDGQLVEEHEKGLSITLALFLRQRSTILTSVKTERSKMFNFAPVTCQFMKYFDARVAAPTQDNSQSREASEAWNKLKSSLTEANIKLDATMKAVGGATIETLMRYAPKGETAALGLESKLIADECLHTSSKKADAKLVRLNSPQFWIREEQDPVPFVVVDLEFPRFVDSVIIRGGPTSGILPVRANGSSAVGENGSAGGDGSQATTTVSTFELKSTEELINALQNYKLDEISGDHEPTHAVLSYVMSWMDLIKSNAVPVKLFARPPVRFLHDVISAVVRNTGFAKDLFTPNERDFTKLESKTEKMDFLNKIIDFVQDSYRKQGENGADRVIIAATASNILAGKEPMDTLKFLCYLGLAAIQHAIQHPPSRSAPSPNKPEAASSPQPTDVSDNNNTNTPEETGPEATEEKQGWVKKLRISTSLTGKQWRVIGDFDGNADGENLHTIAFKSDANAVGRFVQLTCIEWHESPLIQLELFGREACENNELISTMDSMATQAGMVLQHLLAAASMLAEEARTSLQRAKDVEREKHEELKQSMAEITKLKSTNAAYEKEIKELQQCKTTLQENVKAESKKLNDEKAKGEKLQKDLQQLTTQFGDLRKEKEVLSAQVNEHARTIQTTSLQLSEQRKDMELLQKSKTDLEELCSNLRNQLQTKSQNEGHQESKMANVLSDLMSVNVQLEEYKRKWESSEQMRKEQEAATQALHGQLQQQLAVMNEKEARMQDLLKQKLTEADKAAEVLQSEKDELTKRLDDYSALETTLRAASVALEAEVAAVREEIEVWKRKVVPAPSSPRKETLEKTLRESEQNALRAAAGEKLLLEAQTKELRSMAELEKMELKLQACEQKQKEAEQRTVEVERERDALSRRITELEEQDEELQLQIQVVTEERDAARLKEEQLFGENNEKDQEIERIRDGYVWVTDRMNSKEDELAEMQEQLEKYQALLQITGSANASKEKKSGDADESAYLKKLYDMTGGNSTSTGKSPADLMKHLEQWVEHANKLASTKKALPTSEDPAKPSQTNGVSPNPTPPPKPAMPATAEVKASPRPSSAVKQVEPSCPQAIKPSAPATTSASAMLGVSNSPPKQDNQLPSTTASKVPDHSTVPQASLGPNKAPPTATGKTSTSKPETPRATIGNNTEEDAYDDDFDADDGDEAKKLQRRKSSTRS